MGPRPSGPVPWWVVSASVWVGVGAFVVMEPVTALTHRLVMHGAGWGLHRSHHRVRSGRYQANDVFPLVFAGLTMVAMAVGFQWTGQDVIVPATVGLTAYGACYGFVHDVYTHQRIRLPWRAGPLDWLRDAHGVHHQFGQAPYGMLVPIVPAHLRRPARARRAGHDLVEAGAPPAVRSQGVRASRASPIRPATASFLQVGTLARVDQTS